MISRKRISARVWCLARHQTPKPILEAVGMGSVCRFTLLRQKNPCMLYLICFGPVQYWTSRKRISVRVWCLARHRTPKPILEVVEMGYIYRKTLLRLETPYTFHLILFFTIKNRSSHKIIGFKFWCRARHHIKIFDIRYK